MTNQPRVLLINPQGKRIIGDRTPPFHLISLATALPADSDVRILDMRFDQTPLRSLAGPGLALAGITCMIGKQFGHAADLTSELHALGAAEVVWGGVGATQLPELALREGRADAVVCGEGELALRELATRGPGAGANGEIAGVRRLDGDGRPCGSQTLGEQIDLAGIEGLRLDLVRMSDYVERGRYGRALTLLTSRGCPNDCAYCYKSAVYGRRWRGYDADWVVRMMLRLVGEHGLEHVQLMDDNFMVDARRVLRICEGLSAAGNRASWSVFGADVATLHRQDAQFFAALRRAGCVVINIGVESGSPRIQAAICKHVEIDQLHAVNARLREAGIKPSYNFMSGFPEETLEDLRASVALMLRLQADNPQADCGTIKLMLPYPGTALFERVRRDFGFDPPQTVAYWSAYNWGEAERLKLPWLEPRHQRFLVRLYFLSVLLNPDYLFVRSRLFQAVARLMLPLTRLRFKRLRVRGALLPWLLSRIHARL